MKNIFLVVISVASFFLSHCTSTKNQNDENLSESDNLGPTFPLISIKGTKKSFATKVSAKSADIVSDDQRVHQVRLNIAEEEPVNCYVQDQTPPGALIYGLITELSSHKGQTVKGISPPTLKLVDNDPYFSVNYHYVLTTAKGQQEGLLQIKAVEVDGATVLCSYDDLTENNKFAATFLSFARNFDNLNDKKRASPRQVLFQHQIDNQAIGYSKTSFYVPKGKKPTNRVTISIDDVLILRSPTQLYSEYRYVYENSSSLGWLSNGSYRRIVNSEPAYVLELKSSTNPTGYQIFGTIQGKQMKETINAPKPLPDSLLIEDMIKSFSKQSQPTMVVQNFNPELDPASATFVTYKKGSRPDEVIMDFSKMQWTMQLDEAGEIKNASIPFGQKKLTSKRVYTK